MSNENTVGYAGDLLATDAYDLLARDVSSALIDVRSKAEWTFVGAPDLTALGKTPLFIEWQSFPAMQIDPDFVSRLAAMLAGFGVKRGVPLLFLCRCGARSRQSAIAMTGAGWAPCHNISDGFEGPLDSRRHRSAVGGWRAAESALGPDVRSPPAFPNRFAEVPHPLLRSSSAHGPP